MESIVSQKSPDIVGDAIEIESFEDQLSRVKVDLPEASFTSVINEKKLSCQVSLILCEVMVGYTDVPLHMVCKPDKYKDLAKSVADALVRKYETQSYGTYQKMYMKFQVDEGLNAKFQIDEGLNAIDL